MGVCIRLGVKEHGEWLFKEVSNPAGEPAGSCPIDHPVIKTQGKWYKEAWNKLVVFPDWLQAAAGKSQNGNFRPVHHGCEACAANATQIGEGERSA
jgi:hypothetical protein